MQDSAAFLRQLDRVRIEISEVVEEILWESYSQDSVSPDAGHAIACELTAIGNHFYTKKKRLSNVSVRFNPSLRLNFSRGKIAESKPT